jgi:hypothetical protein
MADYTSIAQFAQIDLDRTFQSGSHDYNSYYNSYLSLRSSRSAANSHHVPTKPVVLTKEYPGPCKPLTNCHCEEQRMRSTSFVSRVLI